MVFSLFAAWRILLFFGSFIAEKTVPYLGFFPYKELLVEFGLPTWISSFANFDGIHYLLIAKQGYSQWEQAFFPAYPLLIRTVSFFIPNSLIAALLVSNASFLIGLSFFRALLKEWKVTTIAPLLLLLSFPTAFFFGAIYTEGLFFMLFVLSLYFLQRKNYALAGLLAALSSGTRLIGIFLAIPFFFHFLSINKTRFKGFKLLALSLKPVLLSPFLGLFSYMVYLWTTTGDPLYFFNSQPIFGANRSTNLILLPQVYFRYLKILLTAAHDFRWYMSLLEMSVFSLVFVVLLLDLGRILLKMRRGHSPGWLMNSLGLNIFSFINLVLPTFTGTFSSVPRYALFSLSFFLYLSQIESKAARWGVLFVSITLQIILLSLFIQGYFVG